MIGVAHKVGRMVAKVGKTVTLTATTARGGVGISVLAVISNVNDQPLPGPGLAQFDRTAIISNDEIEAAAWPGPPMRGDTLTIGGKVSTIQAVDTSNVSNEDALHRIMFRGS